MLLLQMINFWRLTVFEPEVFRWGWKNSDGTRHLKIETLFCQGPSKNRGHGDGVWLMRLDHRHQYFGKLASR